MERTGTIPDGLVNERLIRFDRLQEHLNASDSQRVAGADRHGRLVVRGVSEHGAGPALVRCTSRVRAETVAAVLIAADFKVVGLYDLDELAGPDWTPFVGDWAQVEIGGEEYEITACPPAGHDGHLLYHLEGAPTNDYTYDQIINANDQRLPAYYALAEQRVVVIFNTVAS